MYKKIFIAYIAIGNKYYFQKTSIIYHSNKEIVYLCTMITRLLHFLDASPVNFLAASNIASSLEKAGYRRINPCEAIGEVKPGDKLFVTKNDSSVYAFHIGRKTMADAGFRMICAHCDSPTFRIKPNAEMQCEGGIVKLNNGETGVLVFASPSLVTDMSLSEYKAR